MSSISLECKCRETPTRPGGTRQNSASVMPVSPGRAGISLGQRGQRDPSRVTNCVACHAVGISLGRAERRDPSRVTEPRACRVPPGRAAIPLPMIFKESPRMTERQVHRLWHFTNLSSGKGKSGMLLVTHSTRPKRVKRESGLMKKFEAICKLTTFPCLCYSGY